MTSQVHRKLRSTAETAAAAETTATGVAQNPGHTVAYRFTGQPSRFPFLSPVPGAPSHLPCRARAVSPVDGDARGTVSSGVARAAKGLTFFSSLFLSSFLPSSPFHSLAILSDGLSQSPPTELAAEEAGNPDGAGWQAVTSCFFPLPALFLFFSFFLRRRPFLSRSCQRRGRALLVQAPFPDRGDRAGCRTFMGPQAA